MPPVLRGWKPPDLLPVEARLPAPGWEYQELEAVKSLGYTLSAWYAETLEDRCRLVAHELHRSLRQAWEHHHTRKAAESEGKRTPFDKLRQQFFG